MNIFGVGLPEVTVILILALLIFGPKKLPELGRQLGKTLKSLKKASNEFQNEIDQVINETGSSNIRDMGKVMSVLKEKYSGQMDFGKASSIVKEKLNSQ